MLIFIYLLDVIYFIILITHNMIMLKLDFNKKLKVKKMEIKIKLRFKKREN